MFKVNLNNIYNESISLFESLDNIKDYSPVFVILTKGKTRIISSGIKFFTGSEYSHASISFDARMRHNIYSFNFRDKKDGFIEEEKLTFKDNDFTIFCFLLDKKRINKMKKTVKDFKNKKTDFDFKIFLFKIFHINKSPSNDKYKQVCSTFVNQILLSGGIDLFHNNNEIPSPGDLERALTVTKRCFRVFDGTMNEYSRIEVLNKVNKLMQDENNIYKG